jgi:hypothetical protein
VGVVEAMVGETRTWTHKEDGGIYRRIYGGALFKSQTGVWLDTVIYEDVNPASPRFGQVYVTLTARWLKKFKVRRVAR